MERELKFRAFLPSVPSTPEHRGQMFYGYVDFSTEYYNWGATNQEPWEGFYKKELKLMQFTGLIDRNVREIYEGDIVKDCSHSDMVFEVKFNTEKGGYFMPDNFDEDHYVPMADVELAVIGNIYQNPELLK